MSRLVRAVVRAWRALRGHQEPTAAVYVARPGSVWLAPVGTPMPAPGQPPEAAGWRRLGVGVW